MYSELTIAESRHKFDLSKPIDISIPLQFNGPQPNAYGVAPATSIPCAAGDLVGDTRQGGSCNFEQYTFIPHCNGTHTECIGHITNERISVRDCLRDVVIPAVLISAAPEQPDEIDETYSPSAETGDLLITRRVIKVALEPIANGVAPALIIRTMPNAEAKLTREYGEYIAPYFTTEAMQYLVELNIKHLVVDLPSIDRLYDEGRLSNHRIFWNVEQGSFEINESSRRECTVTELAYVPDEASDGTYLLNLQIAPFASDASPARPVLFPVIEN